MPLSAGEATRLKVKSGTMAPRLRCGAPKTNRRLRPNALRERTIGR